MVWLGARRLGSDGGTIVAQADACARIDRFGLEIVGAALSQLEVAMVDETQNMLRYRILRYTPNLVRDEWVNIGVLLEESGQEADGAGRATRRLAIQVIEEESEMARVRRLHPGADEALLRAL